MLSLPLTFLALFATSVLAQTSLYIPGFDPQPISADILGVDSQGRTTWALHKGAITGTFDDSGFVGTATLVEGPNDASFTYVDPAGAFTLGRACSLSGGLAICSATVSGEVATETETADRFLVQAGTTAAASSAPTGGTLPTTTPGGSAPSNPATTSTKSTAAPGPTTTSGALSVAPFLSGLFFSVATVTLYAILI